MGPIDYTSQVQSPFQSVLQGYQGGAAIRNDIQQQQQYQAAQQAAMAQRQQQAEVLGSLINNKSATYDDYAKAITLLPGQEKSLKAAWDIKNEGQQASYLKDVGQVFSAIQANRPDIAAQKLNDRAEQLTAAGADKREIEVLKAQAQAIQASPQSARAIAGMMLAGTPGGKEMFANLSSMGEEQRKSGMYPAELRKSQAEASLTEGKAGITAVEAANAPRRVGLENANIESQIQDRAAGQRIAELDTQIKQANSETQRGQLIAERDKLQLEREKLTAAQTEKKTTAATAEQDKIDTINSSITSVQALAKHPALDQMVGTMTGSINSFITGSSRKDIEAMVETVKSQQFLTGIKQMQGLGALSNAEGDKIGAAVASLSLEQSAKSFKTALGVIQSTLEKAQAKAVASGKLPTEGGAFVQRTPGYGVIDEGRINRAMAAMPGASRDDVMRFMQSQGQTGGGIGGK